MDRQFEELIEATPRLLLRRDLSEAARDPKFPTESPPVYVPLFDHGKALREAPDHSRLIPFDPEADAAHFHGPSARHGLLYLPFPYLVPGGRFNEMYGWDTAFPIFAWADAHPRLMREQVDNQLYQVRLYGKALNANRTYFLSRSQPPLIAATTMRVFRAAEGRDWRDFDPEGLYPDAQAWLLQAFRTLETQYRYWTRGDRLADGGPLSRYWDDSDLPAPEVASSEEGHFAHARAYFASNDLPSEDADNRDLFYDTATGALTHLYHRANRAMRASGFDPTNHWDYGGLRCMFHAPACLNALLYRMEKDMAEIAGALSLHGDTEAWGERAPIRKAAMDGLLRDSSTGLYHDYDFLRKKRNDKPFATYFFAFWAGLYDGEGEAARTAAKTALGLLETPFGLGTSLEHSGSQWDAPYGWPPLQYFCFAGLKRAGLAEDAARIARKYVDLAYRVFRKKGALFEKYNLAEGSDHIDVVHGYHENASEHGTFLWTAAVLRLALSL